MASMQEEIDRYARAGGLGREVLEQFNEVIRRQAARMADEQLFREIYARIGRALYGHHQTTGVPIRPGNWKIFVSRDMEAALAILARRLREPSTALEVSANMNRLGGFDIVGDDDLEDDDIRIRAEIIA